MYALPNPILGFTAARMLSHCYKYVANNVQSVLWWPFPSHSRKEAVGPLLEEGWR